MKRRTIEPRHYFLEDIDPVIRFLIISDTIIFGAVGLLGPIFALFVEDFIIGGGAATAGLAAGIYLFTKSTLQIPIAYAIDKIRGERDDFLILVVFTLIMSMVPLLYLFIDTPLELYFVQFVLGLFTAFTFPTFMAMFTHHVDSGKEGTEWGVYFTLTDITSASFGALGGFLVESSGFPVLIMAVVIISLIGSVLLIPAYPYIRQPRRKQRRRKRE